MLIGAVANQVLRTEIGYAGAAGLLALALSALYRRGSPTASASADVGGGRVGRAEHGGAGDEAGRARLARRARAVSSSMPPSTSIAAPSASSGARRSRRVDRASR